MKSIAYCVNSNGDTATNPSKGLVIRPSFIYLHGSIHGRNEYDICVFNIKAMGNILHLFPTLIWVYEFNKAKPTPCILYPYVNHNKINGLIVAGNDINGIKSVYNYTDKLRTHMLPSGTYRDEFTKSGIKDKIIKIL